jgi:hypothetical protein
LFALSPLPRTIAAALRDLEAKRPEVRRSALIDLVRFADSSERQQVVVELGRSLRTDTDPSVRAIAAVAIADSGLTELLPNLLVALEDGAPRVQQMALLALGEVGANIDIASLERIRPLLQSPLPALRYQALVAWSRLLAERGMAELVAALADDDAEVCWVAWSLIEERIDAVLPAKEASGSAPAGERTRQGTAPDTAALMAALLPHVNRASLRVRIVAASVMLRLGDASHMALLLERIGRPAGVRREDLVALIQRFGRFNYEPARGWLARHARRGWFEGALGWPAMVALAALGDSAAQTAIVQELDAVSARRRERALEAIRDLRLVAAAGKIRWLAEHALGIDPWLVGETLHALGEPREPKT